MNEHLAPSKFRRYRDRKRAAGLREIRLWVPDLRSAHWQEMLALEQASIDRAKLRGPTDDEAAWDRHTEFEIAAWDEQAA